MNISVIILTYNSENNISDTIETAMKISDDIHIVDSYSTDSTLHILNRFDVNVVQHIFNNYSAQRNWAIENLSLKYNWELHLDSDEKLSNNLIDEIKSLNENEILKIDGFFIARLVRFMGKEITHGGMFPIWHLRLFRHGKGQCEDRLYDQHFYVQGSTSKLKGWMIDDIKMNLDEWISRHNRWSNMEVNHILDKNKSQDIKSSINGNPVQKKKFLKGLYYLCPHFLRSFLLFTYRYFFRLGFLDGKEGLIFFVLQTFWFRFLVDAKLHEKKLIDAGNDK